MDDRDAVLAALQSLDEKGDGTLRREELKNLVQTLGVDYWDDAKMDELFISSESDAGRIKYDIFVEWLFGDEAVESRSRKTKSPTYSFLPRSVAGMHVEAACGDDANTTTQLVTDPSFGAGSADILKEVQNYTAFAKLGARTWRVNVVAIQCPVEFSSGRVALFMHGHSESCCISTWGRFWGPMLRHGFHLLAFDAPGFGRSEGATNQTLPWREWDADLVLTLLKAFGAHGQGLVTVFGQCMGGAMFLRALQKSPATFAAWHVLHNCTIGSWPKELPNMLRSKGGGVKSLWWYDADHMRESNVYREFSALMAHTPELCTFVDLQRDCTLPEFFSFSQVEGKHARADHALVLGYCEDAVRDLVSYVCSAPRVTSIGARTPKKTMLEMGGENKDFKVFVRVRPVLRREAGLETCCLVNDVLDPSGRQVQQILVQRTGADTRSETSEFVFERVFRPEATQEDVWDALHTTLDVVGALFDGLGATVFAYGQTSSGKTHTIDGNDSGLMARIVNHLYDRLPDSHTVLSEYIQLYNDDFIDLFAPSSKLSQHSSGRVLGACVLQCTTAVELLHRIRVGSELRASGTTKMNDSSSRSHAILALRLGDTSGNEVTDAPLFVVDLAGSERVKRSGVAGARMVEAVAINQSLLALCNVTQALVENDGRPRAHIPYRDSPLTMLLRNSLGGTARTALICCVSPAADSQDETTGTLKFATCATYVKNRKASIDKKAKERAEEVKLEVALADKSVDFIDGKAVIPTSVGRINCYGDWSGPDASAVLVLLHYYDKSIDARMWSGAFDELKAAGIRYLAPDMPGFGKTPGDSSSKPEDYCKDGGSVDIVLQVLDACGVKRASILGYDWGGGVACSFALKHPTRTQKLIAWAASFPERCFSDARDLQKLQRKGARGDVLVLWAKRDDWHPLRKGQDLAKAFGVHIVEVRLRSAGGFEDVIARALELVASCP